ncbi:MAG: 50S ribosomal protein L6 [Parcubacteria group bacterium RIFCSPHIGHO2_01_FULL_45_26]|nr:ribosomal protein L6 [uncultured bacterium]OHB17544.1 MAG: 50S ribosomal protein L6 [Parcubacteria group bacterium RIFCSPHIGHO2_01_FULL_45_26]
MSRLGKRDIEIPAGVGANFSLGKLSVKGPKGELNRDLLPDIIVTINGNTINLAPKADTVFSRALWGTYSSHIRNMIEGVSKGYGKKLLIEGTGYKWNVVGANINLVLGLSHPVLIPIPAGVKVVAEKAELNISGIDKELVGNFTARIRSLKKPEPYKGKGIRYSDEIVTRKQGKRSTT